VRGWYDGSGWFVGAAVVLVVFALLALLVGLQSLDRVLWTGQQVVGTEHCQRRSNFDPLAAAEF